MDETHATDTEPFAITIQAASTARRHHRDPVQRNRRRLLPLRERVRRRWDPGLHLVGAVRRASPGPGAAQAREHDQRYATTAGTSTFTVQVTDERGTTAEASSRRRAATPSGGSLPGTDRVGGWFRLRRSRRCTSTPNGPPLDVPPTTPRRSLRLHRGASFVRGDSNWVSTAPPPPTSRAAAAVVPSGVAGPGEGVVGDRSAAPGCGPGQPRPRPSLARSVYR